MTSISELEARIAGLPDYFRDRVRTDPDVQAALSRIVDLTEKISLRGFLREDVEALESVQAEVTGKILPCIEQIEVDAQISVSSVPVCLYCGVGFQHEDTTEPSQWARLRRHVEKLHRSDWLALAKKPWSSGP